MVFPEGLVGTTRATFDEQIRLARRLEEAVARELADKPFAQEALPKIRDAREELERQNATYKQATDALNAARTAERAVRVEAATAYRKTYGELLQLFPEDIRAARSFFRPNRDAAAAEDTPEEPPVIDEPAGTPEEPTTAEEPPQPTATEPS